MMKSIKALMLMVAAIPFFASCSDDDKANTNECNIGFVTSQITLDETDGLVQIPIAVEGLRNGHVRLTIETAASGENAAVEGVNYMITDKTLNLNADTLSTGTINVELKVIDDSEINDDRQFTLSIVDVEGAEVNVAQTTVTIADNDADFYKAFAGDWTLTATSLYNGDVSVPLTITAASEGSADYENYLTCTATNILGAGEEHTWRFSYEFDMETMSGRLGLVAGEETCYLSDYGYHLMWLLNPAGSSQLYAGALYSEWQLTDAGTIPTSLTFDPSYALYMYVITDTGDQGVMDGFINVKMTKN